MYNICSCISTIKYQSCINEDKYLLYLWQVFNIIKKTTFPETKSTILKTLVLKIKNPKILARTSDISYPKAT